MNYEAGLPIGSYNMLVGDITPDMITLSAGRESALDDNGGDVDAATTAGDCTEQEQHDFFGGAGGTSACRTCVGSDTYEACVTAGECPSEVPGSTWVEEDGEQVWYALMDGFILGCAPDWTVFVYLLGHMPLADPDWDACEWPQSFVPDEMAISDMPDSYDTAAMSLSTMTYRFGQDDDGIREVLSTNVARGYCPADATGTSWRTYENLPE